MTNYYNENDPQAASWLRALILMGEIPYGEVDERSIVDVRPEDLSGFRQCHFFAGIGGWALALKLAGWPEDKPVWTGSCPCQSFSSAGKQAGTADPRHLWPVWFRLIQACQPSAIFGEQVEAAIRHGWLDLVSTDLEGEGYAVGAVVLPACGIGSPHIRARLWFGAERVADTEGSERQPTEHSRAGGNGLADKDTNGGLADSKQQRLEGLSRNGDNGHKPGRLDAVQVGPVAEGGANDRLVESDNDIDKRAESRGIDVTAGEEGSNGQNKPESGESCGAGADVCRMADTDSPGSQQGSEATPATRYRNTSVSDGRDSRPSPTNGFWANPDWLFCRDGKWRPVESGTFPLVNGVSSRVVRLRGYGNAIVPQVAAEVIKAFMEGDNE